MASQHDPEVGSKDSTPPSTEHNEKQEPLEMIRTISQVPGNANYHMKNGLRLEGDGDDHENFKLTFKVLMAIVGCSIAFAGSQLIPLSWFTLYTFIARDLGATSFVWLKAGSSVGQIAASVTLGPLSDLLGRRIAFLISVFCCILGMICVAATPGPAGFIAGQAIAGFGLMSEELLAIAVTSELVPTRRRAIYGAAMIAGFIPWAPGALYAQLLAEVDWRWIGWMIAIWHAIAFVVLFIFYRPPPRINARGLSRKEILERVDFVGVALGLLGFIVFLIGLFWGGQDYAWDSKQVISTLVVGLAIVVVFVLWEIFFAKYPLFPRRLVQVPITFWSIMFVIFAAGINYVPLAIFWPIESISVFGSNHRETGINTVPVGLCILGGAIISAFLCGRFTKHIRLVMTTFCVMQTAGVGSMAAIDPHNINTAWAPLIFGLVGIGGVLFPNQVVVTIITPDDLLATVTSLTFTLRGVSQVVSLAFLQNRLTANVTANAYKIIAPAAIKAGLTSVQQITDFVKAMTAVPFKEYVPDTLPQVNTPEKYETLRVATVDAFGKSFPLLYYIGLAFGVAACLASWLVGDLSPYLDEHVAVVLH